MFELLLILCMVLGENTDSVFFLLNILSKRTSVSLTEPTDDDRNIK
jgi:hypothetical protein